MDNAKNTNIKSNNKINGSKKKKKSKKKSHDNVNVDKKIVANVLLENKNNINILDTNEEKDVVKKNTEQINQVNVDNNLLDSANKENENNNTLEVKEVSIEDIKKLIEEQKEEKDEEDFKQLENKRKKYNFIEPIIVIVLLIACFIGLYKFILLSPKSLFNASLNNVYNNIVKGIDYIDSLKINQSYSLSSSINLNSTNNNFDKFIKNDYDFTFNYSKDKNIFDGNLTVKDGDLLTTFTYKKENDELYLFNEDLYYYILNFDIFKNKSINLDFSKVKNSLVEIKSILINEVKLKNIEKSNDKISINGKEVDVKKISINYNKDDINKMVSAIKDRIVKDDILINDLADILNIDKDELIDKINNINIDIDNLDLDIYAQGFMYDEVGYSIKINDQCVFSSYKYGDVIQYKVKPNDEDINIIIENKEVMVSYSNVKIINLKLIEYTNNVIDFDYEINKITDKYKGKVRVNKNNNDGNGVISIINVNNLNENLEINFNYLISDYKTDNEFYIDDAVNYNDLTSDDKNNIIANFYRIFE